MSEQTVIVKRDEKDAFITVTLNRPDKMNAMNAELGDALDKIIRDASNDPQVKAIIITGAGRAFSAGYDLEGEDFEMDVEGWRDDMTANCDRLRTIWQAPIPIIAAVNGYALAGGLELMMCCDLAIASEDALLGEPEVRHASGPPSLMMPWTVPMRHTRMLMFTGDLIDGREAERIHMVNKTVPADQLMLEAEKLARKLSRVPHPAIKFAKASLNHQQESAGFTSSWKYNVETTASLHAGKEGSYWMRMLKEKTLKEFLAQRDAPFKEFDKK